MKLGETTSPRNQTINYPYDKIDSPSLVKFLFLVHERAGLQPHREFKTYLRQMKKFLSEVEGPQIIDLILRAIETSPYPFGIDYLRRLYDESVSQQREADN